MDIYRSKEIIVFDLDGTLSKSKGDIDSEMSNLLGELLKIKKVAVITGGAYPQMIKALLKNLHCDKSLFSNLYLFPTDATSFYKYIDGQWVNQYREELDLEQRDKIIKALEESMIEAGYIKPEKVYGAIIEDRETQITFSGLGQNAPLEEKLKWDPDQTLRRKIIKAFEKKITDYDAKIGGSTSIDVNRKGIDKAYGIRQIEKTLNIPVEKMIFIGDALFEGGNDHAVKRTGIENISVDNPEETKEIIREIIK
ncbi:HAD-IIB family hydrolase [Patescibacteria group bacterium]|nr:HAD-IIB family hydrolase [Patescibacteria group bacterium]